MASAASKLADLIPRSLADVPVMARPTGKAGSLPRMRVSRRLENDMLESDCHTAVRHIKAAYDLGINAFDTSNTYSNGLSETILGKAIKTLNLPRDEIVVLTKVYFAVGRNASEDHVRSTSEEKDRARYVNQYGLSRKVCHSRQANVE